MKISALIFLLGFSVLVSICAPQRGAGGRGGPTGRRTGPAHVMPAGGKAILLKINIQKVYGRGD